MLVCLLDSADDVHIHRLQQFIHSYMWHVLQAKPWTRGLLCTCARPFKGVVRSPPPCRARLAHPRVDLPRSARRCRRTTWGAPAVACACLCAHLEAPPGCGAMCQAAPQHCQQHGRCVPRASLACAQPLSKCMCSAGAGSGRAWHQRMLRRGAGELQAVSMRRSRGSGYRAAPALPRPEPPSWQRERGWVRAQ